MNRREFLRKTAVAALMATPAMQAAAFCRDFGMPSGEIRALRIHFKPVEGEQILSMWTEALYDQVNRVALTQTFVDEGNGPILLTKWEGL